MSQAHGFLWVDVPGLSLSPEDKEILAHPSVSGVILFAHNYESISQLRALTRGIAAVSPTLVITADQEGGRVQRFRDGFTELPSMGHWGAEFQLSPEKTRVAFLHTIRTMVEELRQVGVYSSLLPVMDIDQERNAVIGHRSFGKTPGVVTELSACMIDALHTYRMPATGKHFPGHGWVAADSHHELPIDERNWQSILDQDLQPFLTLSDRLDAIMLAHIVYPQMDSMPTCLSRFWVQDVLRQRLHFDGLIVTDDLSMQALAKIGSYEERASRALEAGCDILLVCNARSGVINILDQVSSKNNTEFSRRLSHYARFLI